MVVFIAVRLKYFFKSCICIANLVGLPNSWVIIDCCDAQWHALKLHPKTEINQKEDAVSVRKSSVFWTKTAYTFPHYVEHCGQTWLPGGVVS